MGCFFWVFGVFGERGGGGAYLDGGACRACCLLSAADAVADGHVPIRLKPMPFTSVVSLVRIT